MLYKSDNIDEFTDKSITMVNNSNINEISSSVPETIDSNDNLHHNLPLQSEKKIIKNIPNKYKSKCDA